MAQGDLFDNINQYREPLTIAQRAKEIDAVIRNARLGIKYMYDLREAAGILHMSYDEMQTAMHLYRIDVTHILTAMRVPWWSLAEYLIDPADDIETQFYVWVERLPRKNPLKMTA